LQQAGQSVPAGKYNHRQNKKIESEQGRRRDRETDREREREKERERQKEKEGREEDEKKTNQARLAHSSIEYETTNEPKRGRRSN